MSGVVELAILGIGGLTKSNDDIYIYIYTNMISYESHAEQCLECYELALEYNCVITPRGR